MNVDESRRFLSLTSPAGVNGLLPIEFRGHEALSELFRFELTFLAPRSQPPAFDGASSTSTRVRSSVVTRTTPPAWRCSVTYRSDVGS